MPRIHLTLQGLVHIIWQTNSNSTCTLLWRHNGCDSVSNYQSHDCLLNRLFRRRWKKTSKFGVSGLCAGNSPGTGEFPTQMASYAENVSIWWRHHDTCKCLGTALGYQQAQCRPHKTTCFVWFLCLSLSWWRLHMEAFFGVTGPLCGEFTGHRWIPLTKGQ